MRFAWIDERPFGYHDPTGFPTGCDIALARAAAALLGEPFEPVHTTFAQLLPGLAEGRWQVSTGMSVTAERSGLAYFTRPIWSLGDGLLLRTTPAGPAAGTTPTVHGHDGEDDGEAGGGDEQTITGYRSLAAAGGRLAVLRDQVQATHAAACGVSAEQLVVFEDYHQARAAVRDGVVDAYASVALAHQQHLAAHPDPTLRSVAVPDVEAAPALGAFACADPAMAADLNAALAVLLPTSAVGEPCPDLASWPR